jgi:dihydroneopterin aldolase
VVTGEKRSGGLAVLKVGGSLLSWPEWPGLLDGLVAGMGDRGLAIVVGGGAVVEGLRAIDAAAPQPPQVMHELAIDAMHMMADLVSRVTGLPIRSVPQGEADACVIDVPVWLLDGMRSADLPAGWEVTSDSIAARVASEYGADLLLAKSVPPPEALLGKGLDTLAQSGWVDCFFPTAAKHLDHIAWAAPMPTKTTRPRAGS